MFEYRAKRQVILDVWCNTGYFKKGLSEWCRICLWIDVDLPWGAWMEVIKLARVCKHYWIDNIDFRISNVFDNLDYIEDELDIITCTSTFHYFRDLQPSFWDENKLKK